MFISLLSVENINIPAYICSHKIKNSFT